MVIHLRGEGNVADKEALVTLAAPDPQPVGRGRRHLAAVPGVDDTPDTANASEIPSELTHKADREPMPGPEAGPGEVCNGIPDGSPSDAPDADMGEACTTLKSVGSALDLLGCFAHDTELGVSDVARRLGIAKSTAHRLLTTLRSRGFVEHNPETGLYHLGLRLSEYGNLARDRHPVRHVVLAHLVELRRSSGLPVRVGAPDGGDVVQVDHLSSSAVPAQLEQMPWRLPLHKSASGLAICAFNEEVAAERRRLGFADGSVIRDETGFDAALAQVRATGVSVQADAAVIGITAVAAPILDMSGVAYMAVSVMAPSSDIPRHVERLTQQVVVAAGRIGRSATPVVADRGTPLLPALFGRPTRPQPFA